MNDILKAYVLDGYRLHLTFEDGVTGDVDIASIVEFTGVFEPLKDIGYFQKVAVDAETGTITWPNGADIDPDVLYQRITGEPISLVQNKTSA